jgi:hypothetical protein
MGSDEPPAAVMRPPAAADEWRGAAAQPLFQTGSILVYLSHPPMHSYASTADHSPPSAPGPRATPMLPSKNPVRRRASWRSRRPAAPLAVERLWPKVICWGGRWVGRRVGEAFDQARASKAGRAQSAAVDHQAAPPASLTWCSIMLLARCGGTNPPSPPSSSAGA